MQLRKVVHEHGIAKYLFQEGAAERVARCEYQGLPCQIKMDWLCPRGIIDLKTTADIDNFYHEGRFCDVNKYRYLHSAAFYRSVLHAFDPSMPKQPFFFVAVEKKPPYEVGVWEVREETLDLYEEENIEHLKNLKESELDNKWHSPYDKLRFI